jgi:hypothetical protein
MASGHTAQQLIDAALLLPLADRERIVEVLQDSIDRQTSRSLRTKLKPHGVMKSPAVSPTLIPAVLRQFPPKKPK